MRVCHVVEAGGGAGQVVLNLAGAGIEAGDDVTLIYAPNRQWPSFMSALQAIRGLKAIPLPMQRAVGLHDIGDCLKLYECLRRNGPFDVIHAHSSKAGALTRILRWFFPESVVVYTPHAFVTMAPKASPIYGWIEYLLSWFSDAIICVSEQERRHARDLHISLKKLQVIPNGIRLEYPADRATARARLGFAEDHFVVGFIGRLTAQKNPLCMLRAFAASAQARPGLRLAIVGHGEMQSQVEQAVQSLGIADRTRFFEANGRDLLPGFDCLLCSSDYEGFPLIFPEALAAGVPIVSTPVGGADETIIDGQTGFRADFSAENLARGVLKLAAFDPESKMLMQKHILQRAQLFSIAAMADATRALYRRLLDARVA